VEAQAGPMIVESLPTRAGDVMRDGQRIAWQEFGAGEDVVLLLPTWSIVHSDFWRYQVPFLAERCRVIVFDGLGNGASDRPTEAAYYGDLPFADDAVLVLDACGVERAAVVGTSQGGVWALALAARHPERVTAAVFIGANVPLAPGHPVRVAANAAFLDEIGELDEHPGWAKWNRAYWLSHYREFLEFFFGQCFTEPDSAAEIAHFVDMGLQTSPDVLLATAGDDDANVTPELARAYAAAVSCPALVIHGDEDAIAPLARGEELARLLRSELVVMRGSGHEPQCRNPVATNATIADFLDRNLGAMS
jgi:pimeloyl-ACP methyl ester carboxylesterase